MVGRGEDSAPYLGIRVMKISIVVPAFNEEKLLPGSLRAINAATAAFHERDWETELIVCDNNSSDRTAEVARAEGARVVFEPINQIGRARNCGAAAATGDWLLFIDADSQPSRELLADVADAITSGKYIAGGATVRLDAWFPGMWFFMTLWNVTSRVKKWCAGSFIFVEAQAFRAIGGFSSEFFVSEELDLSQRLYALAKSKGKKMIILRHHPLMTSARKMQLYGHRAHLKFLLKLVLGRGRVLREREACGIWYDGRR
jgi:glycosyltransferase involved in cell wall biosynthesis